MLKKIEYGTLLLIFTSLFIDYLYYACDTTLTAYVKSENVRRISQK